MRFQESECVCGFNLATAEPTKVLYIGKGKDKVPYGECPACGRDYLLTEGEAAPAAETPEPAEPSEPGEAETEPTAEGTGEGGEAEPEAEPATQ